MHLLAQTPTPSPEAGAGGALAGLLPIVVLFGLFYVLAIRPQRTRMRQHAELTRSVEPGDEIETVAGIYGTVSRAEEDVLWVEIAPGTTVRIARRAVGRRIPRVQPGS